jgi:DNA-binding transcriptional ArsR family regulator
MPRCGILSEMNNGSLQNILRESPNGIAELLKLAAHPARIQIMALLLQGKCEFSTLMQETKLSKTAVANHLNQLVNRELVEKIGRGKYGLTGDGRELLTAAGTVYQSSVARQKAMQEALSKRYTEGLKEVNTMRRKTIKKEADYQPCWISYTGSIAGCLKALGTDCDIVDVGGRSGYAFLVNVAKGVTCPSGPTAFHPKVWDQLSKATEELGWAIEWLLYEGSYPEKEGSPTPKEVEKARRMFERVKREIEERNRPVVLWGLVVPEYGIVNGYEGDTYIVSTFRSIQHAPEEPIRFYDLKAPGCLQAMFFRKKAKRAGLTSDKEALRRAVIFVSSDVLVRNNYVAGPAAFEEWATVLEALPEEKQNYHGNSYVAACYCESRWMCAEFLRRLAAKHPGEQSKHMMKAADCYENGWKLLKAFTELFPFNFRGEMKLADRRKGAGLLRQVKPHEEEAIRNMQKALQTWKNV